MTLGTKLSVDQEYLKSFSEKHQEPAWLKNLRLQALEQAEDLPMPKPDKTKSQTGTSRISRSIQWITNRFLH